MLPKAFSGEGNVDDWIDHFEGVAAVNGWKAEESALWLRARLTGRALATFKILPEETRRDFKEAVKALRRRFEPESKRERYLDELNSRRRKRTEDWADFGQDVKCLADKAYPDLEEAARQQLALQHYLGQIENPQIAFGVKQRRPKTVEETVGATLELESYLAPGKTRQVAHISAGDDREVHDLAGHDGPTHEKDGPN